MGWSAGNLKLMSFLSSKPDFASMVHGHVHKMSAMSCVKSFPDAQLNLFAPIFSRALEGSNVGLGFLVRSCRQQTLGLTRAQAKLSMRANAVGTAGVDIIA